ncbi:MAG TPA: carbon-nitrogen hydrolase family protein [Polyangium sp.]|nr:carbon-nitrogen hydrolase family protein [Polyangium sp.]
MSTTVELAACQVYVSPETYASEASFGAMLDRIGRQLEDVRATRGPEYAYPCLAVFPEMIGTFLPLVNQFDRVRGAKTTDEALQRVGRGALWDIIGAMARGKTLNSTIAFLLAVAPQVRQLYRQTFSRFAQKYNVWTVAGSALLPKNAYGDLADEFLPADGNIYNTSYIFNPRGRHVGVVRKVNLVPTVEDTLGLSPGRKQELWPVSTPFGQVGTLICYDGFRVAHTPNEPGFQPLLAHYDAHDCHIVAHPAANFWPWEEPWTFQGAKGTAKRHEQWVQEGLLSQMEQTPMKSVQYAVTAQLIGQVFDNRFDGRSQILERTADGARILAEAPRGDVSLDSETVVLRVVDV